ncbi:M14 family zinc carboxypeptidase [Streptomyces sp. NPDC012508]|uniref:M14 family zinc carboxypeptidase n=1 Tax=Streptomyces sp. NPDC012508 TaxID=3364837 RepID=UPI0036A5735B
MRRRAGAILAAASLLIAGLAATPVAGAEPRSTSGGADGDTVSVWRAKVTKEQVPLLLEAGTDGHELTEQVPEKGSATLELYLTDEQAGQLRGKGVELAEHTLSTQAEKRVAGAGDGVFRPYGGAGGLKQEILATSQAHPDLTKVVSIGRTVKGQDILAVKVTKGAKKARDGSKPATLYMSNQHAREWITPEMTRRLLHHYLDGYGTDSRITKIVDSTELWFVLSANPDGYDFTHADPGNRQWRKNLRDNNGDGRVESGDGVDLNRNFSYKWGYDNEGSSPDPADETYRGTGPMSEPETKAIDAFQKRIGFQYGINYHSAAQLLLYGVGWQVATDTPDDVALKALAGTPGNSAVPGYRPQVSSELYTTNGEADGHGGAAGNPLDNAGAYTVTSDTLKPRQFPQFGSSRSAGDYPGVRTPFEPYEGTSFAAVRHVDDTWTRLSRTVDLTGVTAAQAPSLRFQVSYDTEPGYDNLVVEAHTAGQDDWTTLPDANGGTSAAAPADCGEGYYVQGHPFLAHYLTVGEDGCATTGTTGAWHAFTGPSNGWRQASIDLSAYAGKQVELSISYVSDPGTGEMGAFVDDTALVVGGTPGQSEGFEAGLGAWSVPGPPAGSPGNGTEWTRSAGLFHSQAAVTTRDTVLLGFGLEHVTSTAQRTALIRKALGVLHG